MKKLDLTGQKFGKLTVISAAENILPQDGYGRSFTAWNCQCDCGKVIIVRAATLTSGLQKSCGCTISQYGRAIKPGERFTRLITVSYEKGFWDCICDCGEKTTVETNKLMCKNTRSCGCIKKETMLENRKKRKVKDVKKN